MKIGILTFVNANNFGALLQAYASQQYLKCVGKDTELINYVPPRQQSINQISKLVRKVKSILHLKSVWERRQKTKKCEDFRNNYLNLSEEIYTDENMSMADRYNIIIAGSDQIWNTDLNGKSKSFFFGFNTTAKKVTYAVSVGRKLTEEDRVYIHRYASLCDWITVRETDLKNYLREAEHIETTLVCDPVFLLEKEQWERMAVSPVLNKKYIFVYAMEDTKVMRDAIKYLKKEKDLQVYYVWGGGYRPYDFPGKLVAGIGPCEFLGWLHNAEYVLTNSFHGAAFSVIFRKKLFVVGHTMRNIRLIQLLDECGYACRMLAADFTCIQDLEINGEIAYNHMNELIIKSRKAMEGLIEEHV